MLKREEYIKTVYRPYPPLFTSLILIGANKTEYYTEVIDEPFRIRDMLLVDGVWYYCKRETEEASRIVFKDWLQPKKLAHAKKIFAEREQAFLRAAEGDDFDALCEAYEAYATPVILVWRADEPVAQQIRTLLLEKLPEAEADELLHTLNIPEEDNFHRMEELELVQTDDIEAHVKKYEWIKSRYGAIDPYTVAEAKEKRAGMNPKEFLQEYRAQKQKVREAIAYAKKLLGRDAAIVDFIQYIVYYRTQRTDVINRVQYAFASGLKKFAKKRRVSYEQLIHATREEVAGDMPSQGELDERIRGFAIVEEAGKLRCVSGKALDEVREFFHEDIDGVSEFKGRVACPGNAQGAAKVVFGVPDFHKVEEGDVLVTPMTNPHMIPVMKKAAAFVTDEGGITCHAAVLSREMKKPCIIGTRIATQVLKDGDRVEVDAEKGVVRKI